MSGGRAGFVLAGGRSSRMGRDKALLPAGSGTLAGQIAAMVRQAAGNVTLIGPPERYSFLGFPVVADAREGCGPLGGLYTALRLSRADWNLVVACDMPGLTAPFLVELFDAAARAGKDCVVPVTAGGLEPLCAVYHARLLPAAESALDRKQLAMHDFVRQVDACLWPVRDTAVLENLNTPEQWSGSRLSRSTVKR